jgi:hypothetical protein
MGSSLAWRPLGDCAFDLITALETIPGFMERLGLGSAECTAGTNEACSIVRACAMELPFLSPHPH